MNFLIDEQLPPALAGWLRDRGFPAEHVLEIGLGSTPDVLICRRVQGRQVVLVSKDSDYSHLAPGFEGVQLLWVRVGNVVNRELLKVWETHWPRMLAELRANARLVELP